MPKLKICVHLTPGLCKFGQKYSNLGTRKKIFRGAQSWKSIRIWNLQQITLLAWVGVAQTWRLIIVFANLVKCVKLGPTKKVQFLGGAQSWIEDKV